MPATLLRPGAAGSRTGLSPWGGVQTAAMLAIGVRPTIGEGLAQTIEVNLLDFSADLYGQLLTLEFVAWLRGEEKYDSLAALTAQLARDAEATRAALGR